VISMPQWVVLQYQQVFDDFYAQCDEDLQVSIDNRVSQLMERGNLLREPVSEYLEDGICQLRAKSGRHQARLLYYFDPGRRAIIVVAFFKDQRKVERKYIDQAKRIRDILRAEQELASGIHQAH